MTLKRYRVTRSQHSYVHADPEAINEKGDSVTENVFVAASLLEGEDWTDTDGCYDYVLDEEPVEEEQIYTLVIVDKPTNKLTVSKFTSTESKSGQVADNMIHALAYQFSKCSNPNWHLVTGDMQLEISSQNVVSHE